REAVLGPRSYQVVADLILMLEERGRDHRADRVAPEVLGTRATAPIPVKAGEGIKAAGLKLSSQHIAISHQPSIAGRSSGRVVAEFAGYEADRSIRRTRCTRRYAQSPQGRRSRSA